MTFPLLPQALAHQHTYALFSRLYLQGITADLSGYLQSIPQLSAYLPDPFDPEQAAAEHHNLFVFNVYPNASIFLDESRLLGGPFANAHDALYRRDGFVSDPAVDPDHISQSLAYLSYISQAEARALETGEAPDVWQHQAQEFLQNHLLPWLVPFTVAVQQEGRPFYTELSSLTLALAAEHSRTLPLSNEPTAGRPSTSYQLSIASSTTLRDIARHLLTPIHAGIYLSRSTITRLARRLNLPHGFGSREQMLETLFRAAGQYEAAPRLFAYLHEMLSAWHQAYSQAADDYPHIATHIFPWQSCVSQTKEDLSRMEDQLDEQREVGGQGE